jgi:ABC-type antimicrobial peptide transport system permease subunit
MTLNGKFRERLLNSWVEMRENFTRSTLQSLGVILGVAAVLGGFSISDSMRKRSMDLYVKMGGLDKLNVRQSVVVKEGAPTALQMANLGLRTADATEAEDFDKSPVDGVSLRKDARARVRSPYADQERDIRGIGRDFLALDGYEIDQGRDFTIHDIDTAAPVAILGTEPVSVFFPNGDALGRTIRIGDTPVQVVGILRERVFRFRDGQRNIFRWKNRVIAIPTTLVARRFEGDNYHRVDRVTFRIRNLDAMAAFSKGLSSMLKANHRQQDDFRLDDVAARVRKEQSQGQVYDIIFLLSGFLSLIGGGIVNVNIQMATLKERIREVGVKMAIGAPGGEIFKEFMTEALLLTGAGSIAGLIIGVGFSKIITASIGVPLHIDAKSFVSAYALAAVFGFVFALFPAWKASRLSPMEALRYE